MSALGFPAPGWRAEPRQMPMMRQLPMRQTAYRSGAEMQRLPTQTWQPQMFQTRQPQPVYRQIAPSFDRNAWRRVNDNHQRAYDHFLDRQRYAQRMAMLAQQQGTAQAQAAAAAAQQQLLAAQTALATAQAAVAAQQPAPGTVVTAPAPSPVVMQPSMPSPQPDVSPGNATQDMSTTQDAAAAASAPPVEEHPGHGIGRKVVIALVLGGLAFGGYKFMKSRKGKGSSHAPTKHPAMHGARRRRFRRR